MEETQQKQDIQLTNEDFLKLIPTDISIKDWKRLKKIEDLVIVLYELHKIHDPKTKLLINDFENIGYKQAEHIVKYFNLNINTND